MAAAPDETPPTMTLTEADSQSVAKKLRVFKSQPTATSKLPFLEKRSKVVLKSKQMCLEVNYLLENCNGKNFKNISRLTAVMAHTIVKQHSLSLSFQTLDLNMRKWKRVFDKASVYGKCINIAET